MEAAVLTPQLLRGEAMGVWYVCVFVYTSVGGGGEMDMGWVNHVKNSTENENKISVFCICIAIWRVSLPDLDVLSLFQFECSNMNLTTAKTDMSVTRIYCLSAMAELIIITTELSS